MNPSSQAVERPAGLPPRRAASNSAGSAPAASASDGRSLQSGASFRRALQHHDRSVSWDDSGLLDGGAGASSGPPTASRVSFSSSSPSSRILPVSDSLSLSSGSPAQSPIRNQHTPTRRSLLPPPRPSRRHLDLMSGGLNPESEAEAYLLKALEDRDPVGPGVGENILNGVPTEIGHDFELIVNTTHPKKAAASKSSDPVIQAASKLTSADAAEPKHRRNLTVEQTIFGLSSALHAIHDTNDHHRHHHHPEEIALEDSTAATDRLARTVNILFNRSRANTGGSTSASGHGVKTPKPHQETATSSAPAPQRTPASHWGKLRQNLGNVNEDGTFKKTDDPQDALEDGFAAGVPTHIEADTSSNDSFGAGDETKEGSEDSQNASKSRRRNPFRHLPYGEAILDEWKTVGNFLKPRKDSIFLYLKIATFYMMVPLIGIAAILYYFFENPPTGRGRVYGEENTVASASWWLLFAVRNIVTFTLAKFSELFVIDLISLQTSFTLNLCGPVITLLIVQSKGWPFLLSAWAIFDFALLYGSHPITNHWLYWQDYVDLFNRQNPGGDVTENELFLRVLVIALVVGIVVSIKRLTIGLYLGRKTFSNYSKKLAKVMNKMLLISEVSAEGREVERLWKYHQAARGVNKSVPKHLFDGNLNGLMDAADEEDDGNASTTGMTAAKSQASSIGALERIIESNTGQLSSSQRARITQLLGRWEEPARGNRHQDYVSITAVLQFRRALAHMDTDLPFSPAFGLADTREACVASSQELFLRLLNKTPDSGGVLPFETIAAVALKKGGRLDTEKVKDLIRVFRPDRDGSLALIDFVRSIDTVYKELRLLRATVVASSKIDEALENILNVLFYAIMWTIILSQLGYDPLTLFLSLSSIILAFAFMIGSASAKYFEGVLFILVQRPFDIGDRINVSNSESESSSSGSQGWIVEDVTLFTTSVVLAATNERATISNGSLAKSRIINGGRSRQAVLFFTFKFGLEVPFEKIETFRSAVEKFVKARPREWLSLIGCRTNRVEADLGFIEYIVILSHRENWQNIGALLNSKAVLQNFCLELQKKMNMRYLSPPLPVNLSMGGNAGMLPGILGLPIPPPANEQKRGRIFSDDIDPASPDFAHLMEKKLGSVAAMFEGK